MAEDKIIKSDAEWRAALTREQYNVTRKHGTEQPGSSKLLFEKRDGTFACACCGEPLFSSDTKFDAHCGWPSFYQPMEGEAVSEHTDTSHGMRRTEVRCARCDAHLGHVFPDGPRPTGLRYCINGVALAFDPSSGPKPDEGGAS
jgi:peptide-methionine (R)-S-oxide reductase